MYQLIGLACKTKSLIVKHRNDGKINLTKISREIIYIVDIPSKYLYNNTSQGIDWNIMFPLIFIHAYTKNDLVIYLNWLYKEIVVLTSMPFCVVQIFSYDPINSTFCPVTIFNR